MKENDTLAITVRDRNGMLYEGAGEAVSSFNDKGPFDILPRHESFICLIQKFVVIRISKSEEKRIELDSGVLKVRDNNVEVYVGILK